MNIKRTKQKKNVLILNMKLVLQYLVLHALRNSTKVLAFTFKKKGISTENFALRSSKIYQKYFEIVRL